ncbi:cytochrome P450 [Xylariaceae sp. FL0016]|nr:cytochrome P450 [Xylariaceae sp. FL0016]
MDGKYSSKTWSLFNLSDGSVIARAKSRLLEIRGHEALFIFPAILLILFLLRSRPGLPRHSKPLPGPKGYPIIGNLSQIPPKHSWLKFKEWADIHGPIYGLRLGNRQHVVLSTEKVANQLLRERGGNYSSREQTVMAAELLSDNLRPLLLPYNDRWRRVRKVMHQLTMPTSAATYEPTQLLESTRAIHKLMEHPEMYQQIFQQYSSGVVFRIGYGKRIVTGKEEPLRRIIQVNHHLERIASPGSYLVDTLPVLKYLPTWLAPFKNEGARLHDEELGLFRELLEEVRQKMHDGTAVPCFASEFIRRQEKSQLSDDEGAYLVGTMFEAGSGTTAAAMLSFCLAMTLYPEWQKLVWEELDRVCPDRLPDFQDIPKLPSVRAVIKETMRWHPVTSGGVPHQSVRDDTYDGYFLPRGSVVHANQWAIHREPALYPDPERFNPQRWLLPEYPTYEQPLSRFPNLQNYSCFGFGRRICPGMNVAERSLYILAARILWAFEFSKKRSADGREIHVPEYDYIPGFNTQPKPFHFSLKIRTETRKKVLKETWKKAQELDPLRD